MSLSISLIDGKLKLSFPYQKDLIDEIKNLPDRKYNPTDHSWLVGFSNYSLTSIIDLLAKYNWPADVLNSIEAECKTYLSSLPSGITNTPTKEEFETKIKPPIMLMAELVLAAYMRDEISNADQIEMINILTHLSLKDFI